jgi:NhaP-type Na+/H+ or K+/H+ antiporter
MLVTWAVAAVAARYILDFDWNIAALLGALLVVSGPTVVLPLLKQVRPVGIAAKVLKWEGILIDPIGVLLGVLVLDAVLGSASPDVMLLAGSWVLTTVLTVVVGCLIGLAVGVGVTKLLKRHLIPDHLQNAVTLMIVGAVYTGSEMLFHEAGLFAVTVMGVFLANQTSVAVKHIAEFKENLTTLLLAGLFIVLAANVDVEQLKALRLNSFLFLAVLVFVARPLAVWVSTLRSGLPWQEKVFLAAVAPRGIVAAAVSALFALRLEAAGVPGAESIVPETFFVIVGTVALYGLSAGAVARYLGLQPPNPQGFLIVGAQPVGRAIARALKLDNHQVLLIDGNRGSVTQARLAGFDATHGDILDHDLMEYLDLGGIGRILAVCPNDEVNTLAALHFAEEVFDKRHCYQLANPDRVKDGQPNLLRCQTLFGPDASYRALDHALQKGMVVRATKLTVEFTLADLMEQVEGESIPLFLIHANGRFQVVTAEEPYDPQPGTTLIHLSRPTRDAGRESQKMTAAVSGPNNRDSRRSRGSDSRGGSKS